MHSEQRANLVGVKRRLAGNHLVHHHRKRIQIGTPIDRLPVCLLRCDIGRGSDGDAHLCEVRIVHQEARVFLRLGIVLELRDPEVENLREIAVVLLVDEDHVLGLDVAVNDPGLVRVVEGAQHVSAYVKSASPLHAMVPLEKIGQQ